MKKIQILSSLFFFWIVSIGCGMSSLAAPKIAQAAQAPAPVFEACAAEQQATLQQALRDAVSLTLNSVQVLTETPENERGISSRYNEWFGAYDAAHYALVLANYQRIADALTTQTITFTCGSTAQIYASVQADSPYEIALGASFWSAPVLGTNSQAGTLVHEMSHFTAVAGTEDHVYGQIYSRMNARYVPAKAIHNADSYRFFAENEINQ
jgi:peptidyl-Lys metalloendopeptidase